MQAALQATLQAAMQTDTQTERYRVAASGATALALAAGDRIEIVDPQGRQPCELVAFDSAGAGDPGLLGADQGQGGAGVANGTARPLRSASVLSAPLVDARRVRAGLQMRGIGLEDLAAAKAIDVFAADAPAGAQAGFTAEADVSVVVAAPGEAMGVEGPSPPTDLVVWVHRASPPDPAEPYLPAPLADPAQDFTIDAATARAYEVAKGDYFQVVDIEGRECSDFQCFAVRDLDGGLAGGAAGVRCLDPTITRTLMGSAYPGPGLYSKFYSAGMQPLVEVVQDTVGRHDMFNTACNSRYYEEMGFPGHANCTDNINGAWAPYGVAQRRGWEAVNFFYNTGVDDKNQIYFDEPWSRPGDYVLLRALDDLVCVSTACPCDIDPANGWNPTDIQIRVYPAANVFKKATAIRMTVDSEAQLTKETGFHARTSELTRDFADYAGYWLPNSFTDHGATAEYWACRQAVSVMDLSPLRKYEVAGPDAEQLMQTCVTRNVRKLSDGQVVYTAMCYPTGGMIDDGTVFRLSRTNYRWIGGSDDSGLWLRKQAAELGLQAWVKNSSDQLHNLAVQGPNSRELLERIVWTRPDQPSVTELGWFRFAIGRIGDHDGIAVVVSRTGYTGELGYEVFCHPSDGPAVWDAISEAGADLGLAPMGLEALDMLRIEAGLVFAGQEFCDQTDPMEAGIGFTVPLKTKQEDFIGRAALESRKANPQRVLVGLELEGGEPGAPEDDVYVGRAKVGTITSGTISPTLTKNVALCRMAVQYAEIGSEVEVGKIDGHQKRIPATVVRFPFYDPDKTRVRS